MRRGGKGFPAILDPEGHADWVRYQVLDWLVERFGIEKLHEFLRRFSRDDDPSTHWSQVYELPLSRFVEEFRATRSDAKLTAHTLRREDAMIVLALILLGIAALTSTAGAQIAVSGNDNKVVNVNGVKHGGEGPAVATPSRSST